jgi:hypothetical protein
MGTTLEVLQNYLFADIDLEYIAQSDTFGLNEGERGRMISLNAIDSHRVRVKLVDGSRVWLPVEKFLPVLKSFDQLCTPLSTGEVPAVEVAKIILEAEQEWRNDGPIDWAGVTAEYDGAEITIWLHGRAEQLLAIWPQWELQEFREAARPWHAAYDYLRSKHFAVGLTSQDFIRKEN